MAAAGPSSSASPFAALLRRSKFASFDPNISQVYTTYGGDAHRGNWGLKRPLPVRRRNAFITVTAVDSPEQQTEWRSGENQARWIKKWAELGVEVPQVTDGRNVSSAGFRQHARWEQQLGNDPKSWHTVDSEFVPRKSVERDERPRSDSRAPILPNIAGMSDDEFARYLNKLRKLRPAFKQYLQKRAVNSRTAGLSLFEQAQAGLTFHKDFLTDYTRSQVNNPASRTLTQQPHPYAGLSYSHATQLQTYFATNPLPGRMVSMRRDESAQAQQAKSNIIYVTSFAGMNTRLRAKDADGQSEILSAPDGTPQRVDAGHTRLRLSKAYLQNAPTTVGRDAGGLFRAKIETDVKAYMRPSITRPNPHYPGSREYVGHMEGTSLTAAQHDVAVAKKMEEDKLREDRYRKKEGSSNLISNLRGMLKESPPST